MSSEVLVLFCFSFKIDIFLIKAQTIPTRLSRFRFYNQNAYALYMNNKMENNKYYNVYFIDSYYIRYQSKKVIRSFTKYCFYCNIFY